MDNIKFILIEHSWFCLFVAIFFGVLGTVSLKLSHGLQKWKPTFFLIFFYLISFTALTLAVKGMAVSIVYAIWSGLGTIFVAIIGSMLFNESMSIKKIFSLLLIVVGMIGIHLTNAFH